MRTAACICDFSMCSVETVYVSPAGGISFNSTFLVVVLGMGWGSLF